MTYLEIYLKMIKDVEQMRRKNWKKLEQRVGRAVLTHFKGKRR